jgi:hypothetical protein
MNFGQSCAALKKELAPIQNFGENWILSSVLPRLCRNTGPPLQAGFVF